MKSRISYTRLVTLVTRSEMENKHTSSRQVLAGAAHCVVVNGAVQDQRLPQCAPLVGRAPTQLGERAGVETLGARLAHGVGSGGACQKKLEYMTTI